MNSDCGGCAWYYYEPDTNYKTCTHVCFDENEPDNCPGEYAIADAKADAKYGGCDKY